MGSGLRELVEAHRAGQLTGLDLRRSHLAINPRTGRQALVYGGRSHMLVDTQNRPLVRIVLDGSVPMSKLRSDLRTLGVGVAATDPNWRGGILEAHLPLEQAETVARMPGVMSVHLLRAPRMHVGSVTTQGASILHSDQANTPGVVTPNGVTGRGITIGVLSDSFDTSGLTPAAGDDVQTGDLPNIGVADGRPGLKFLIDGPDQSTDEGRAVAEIAYDMAPGSSLCFATAVLGPVSFANNIRRLRTDSQCAADVLVDDLTYPDEPVFSDGPIAQAVNDVATSTTLAGKRVAYFAAAGNGAGSVYSSDLRFIADPDARALTGQPIDLTTIPSRIDTSGGFHNFNPDPNGPPAISQQVSVSDAFPGDQTDFFLQWDDPFDVTNGITTDLNLLVFDSTGKYLGASSDNNFSTQEPFEAVGLAGNFRLRFVIARTGRGAQAATKVFWSANTQDTVVAEFLDPASPAMFGHATAKGAIAVGAYWYDNGMVNGQFTPELESYSSNGPTTICCDAVGNRLGSPEIRQKPEISAVDGVDTTFFGNAGLVSTSFSFFGTSAAAPHAAGIAALLLEAAGGSGSLTSDQIRSKLIASTGVHDLDPGFSQAVLGDGNTVVKLVAQGGEDPSQLINKKFFNLQFASPTAGQTLASLTIDLSNTPLYFNVTRATGFAMAVGAASNGVQTSSTVPAGTRPATVTITFTNLQSGGFVQFGIGRAQKSDAQDGLSADLLGGATVTATLANPAATLTGTIVNKTGTGYGPADGWGLIDAVKAIKAQ
jgi:hypothetical protein